MIVEEDQRASNKTWPVWLAIIAYVFFLFLIAFKVVFVATDPSSQMIVPANLLWDDGGVYVSEATVLGNWSMLSNQAWFQEIQAHLSQADLFAAWGNWAPKITFIFTRGLRDGWLAWLVFLRYIVGNYTDAFRASMILFPVFVLGKYCVLFFLTRREPDRFFPLLFGLLFVDWAQQFDHGYYWFTTSAYAYNFFSAAFLIRAFSSSPQRRLWFWLLAAIAASMSRIAVPVVLVFLVVDILEQRCPSWYQYLGRLCERYFLSLNIGALFFSIIIGALYYIIEVMTQYFPTSVIDNLFHIRIFFAHWLIVTLIGVFFLLRRYVGDNNSVTIDYGAARAAIVITLYLFGVVGLVIISPFVGIEIAKTMTRLGIYLYLVLIMGIGRMLYGAFRQRTNASIVVLTGLVLGAFSLGVVQFTSPTVWSIDKFQSFSVNDYPSLLVENGVQYYLATSQQQVYGYFIDSLFTKAPLVLDITQGRYSRSRVVELLNPLRYCSISQ
ncbi:MAG: hypothetical protein HY984_02075 [Candidatus Magasanikbacteria bacterium]|nr:hypothetical protein [Candidatus Magasanikbacteria bacterium]